MMPRLIALFSAFLLLSGTVLIAPTPLLAQSAENPSADDILEALLPHGMDGRRIHGARSADAALGGRGVDVEGGETEVIPSIDLRVGFEYDSAVLTNDGGLLLDQLGQALAHPDLHDARIRIVGHTDDAGSAAYNRALSERRAAAVRDYVIAHFGLDAGLLDVRGAGKTGLLDGIDPLDARNRRVEVQNISREAPPDCFDTTSSCTPQPGG